MKKLLAVFFGFCIVLGASDITVLNRGIGGYNSRQGLSRVPGYLQQDKPQAVVLGYGGNDVFNSKALIEIPEYKANMEKMIDLCREAGVRVIVVNSISPGIESYLKARHQYPFDEDLNARVERYNQVLREIAGQKKVILNDFHKLMNDNGGATEDAKSLVRNAANSRSRDGLHLTAAGSKLLGESVAELLKSLVKPGEVVLCAGDSLTWGAALPGAGTATGQTYPAWLYARLNNLASPPAPSAAPEKSAAVIFNGSFEADIVGELPAGWVLAKGAGAMSVQQYEKGNFLRLTPEVANKPAFLRTDAISIAPGKYTVKLRAAGSGEFEISGSIYPAKGGNPQQVNFSKEWFKLGSQWQEYSCEFEIPAGYNRFCLIIRQRGGSGDFDDIAVGAEAGKSAAVLKNSHMKVEFLRPEDGGGVRSIANAAGVEFINRKSSGILWEIRMKKIKVDTSAMPPIINLSIDPEQDDGSSSKNNDAVGNDLVFSSVDAVRLGAKCEVKTTPETVEFLWKNIKINAEENALDIRAKFELKQGELFCMIDGGFVNRSKEYTVFYFALPQLDGLGAIRNNPADDFLATPFYNGRLINNPVEKNLLGKNRLFQPNRSGHSMQFDAIYNRSDGLYLASFDPDQYVKRYLLETSSAGGLKWAVFNIPDNMRRMPQEWQVPYRSGFRTFQGDWYDGCMIYRDWALKQYWSAEGPVATRKSIPQWFKDIDEWFQCASVDINTKPELLKNLVADFGNYKLGAWLTHWGIDNKVFHGMNPERFPLTQTDTKVMNFLRENKIPAMGYIQCTSWNDLTESYRRHPDANDNMVRNYNGQMIQWPKKKDEDGNEIIAYPGKLWRKVLGDAVVKMAESGFSAAYMDSGNHGGTYLNFTPACSPESGGGTGYIKQNQELLRELRDRARQVNPDFCLNAESFWEGNIAHLDAFLVCNTTNAYLEGSRVTPIPMVQAVYHDYTLMYSAWTGRGDTERDNARGYVAKHGLAFCWGLKPGWDIMNLLYKYPNHEEVLRTSKIRHEAYAKGKKYLVYGRMLREPQTREEMTKIPVKWHRGYGMIYFDIVMDKVFKTTWKTANGDFAAVLYNIDEEPQTLTLVLDKKEYQLGNGKFSALYPEHLEFETTDTDNQYLLKINIPPRSPAILELLF